MLTNNDGYVVHMDCTDFVQCFNPAMKRVLSIVLLKLKGLSEQVEAS